MGSYMWVISPLIRVISIVTLLITPLITTHEPSSKGLGFGNPRARRSLSKGASFGDPVSVEGGSLQRASCDSQSILFRV